MSNRAKQIDVVLAGFRDILTDNVLSGGTVEFYESGTSTPKNAWNDATKTVAVTSITLDADGKKLVYGEGIYKLIVKDSVGSSKYTLDPIKVEHPNVNVVSKTSSYTATIDDDFILVDTSAGDVTITMPSAASMLHFIVVQKTSADSNNVIIDPSGSELINGAATMTFSQQEANKFVFSNGSNLYASGGFADNAETVDLIHASATPVANELLALDSSSKFPNSTLYTGEGNGIDADTVDTIHASTTATANKLLALDGSGLFPLSTIPTNLTGKNADQLDGLEGSQYSRTDYRTGQTWQSVTRVNQTVYQNTTSKPIDVRVLTTGDYRTDTMFVGTTSSVTTALGSAGGMFDTFVVPAGWYYKITFQQSGSGSTSVFELR